MHYTVHGILQDRVLEWVAFPFSRGSSQPRDWTQVSCIAGGFFTRILAGGLFTRILYQNLRPQGKPKNTGVASLSLQRIFPTQELNQGLLHCRRILYQLSYQGNPTRSCLTLCNPIDCSLLGSSVHGISQAKILEWVAIPCSRGLSRPRDQTLISCLGRQILYHLGSPYSFFHLRVFNDPSHSWLQTSWKFKYRRKNKNSLDSHTIPLPSLREIAGFSLFCRLRDFLVCKWYKNRHIKNT